MLLLLFICDVIAVVQLSLGKASYETQYCSGPVATGVRGRTATTLDHNWRHFFVAGSDNSIVQLRRTYPRSRLCSSIPPKLEGAVSLHIVPAAEDAALAGRNDPHSSQVDVPCCWYSIVSLVRIEIG